MAHKVFISYAAEDKPTAMAICSSLEAQGIKCWIAPRDILPGTPYGGAIVKAINASRVFVLVFSSNSNGSPHVASEVERAFSKEIPIITFRIENLMPSENMAFYLSTPHWLDALTPPLEDYFAHLTETVENLLKDKPPPPPPLPPPPIVRAPRPWKLILLTIGIVLAVSIVALSLFKLSTGNGSNTNSNASTLAGGNSSNSTGTGNTGTANNVTPKPTETAGPVITKPAETVDYKGKYNTAIAMLGDPYFNLQKHLEGVRLLDEVCGAGDEKLYWEAMNQLTAYVRAKARWKDGAPPLQDDVRQVIFKILEVIAARPPAYPANADDRYKRTHRRDLKFVDLRGLRLVGGRAHLEYVDFLGANLEGAHLPGALLEGAMLREATLTGNVNLYEADMTNVDLQYADINKADLKKVKGLKWFDVKGAYNWQCANLDDELRNEVRTHATANELTKKCE